MIIFFKSLQKGFSLIELLVSIGILAVLISITLIAVNPARQFGQANDTKRATDVLAILNSINQYLVDPTNSGNLPGTLNVGNCAVGLPCMITNDALVTPRADICSALVTEYIAALPQDPSFDGGDSIDCSGTYNTRYLVEVGGGTSNRVTVIAPAINTYSGVDIKVTR